jgi:hypothetical protein
MKSRSGWFTSFRPWQLLLALLVSGSTALALQEENIAIAAVGAFMLVFVIIGLGLYVYVALALQTIAKKTNTANAWMAWIPVVNIVLMLNVAQKPIWWIVLCLIPLVNIVIFIIVWMAIAKARNKPDWWGILMIVPFVNLVVPGYLAWAD